MIEFNPLFNGYWADKYDHLERIQVPMYILGSYTSFFTRSEPLIVFGVREQSKKDLEFTHIMNGTICIVRIWYTILPGFLIFTARGF